VKNKKVLLIAGVLALFAAVLTVGLVSSLEQKYRRGAQPKEVLVAKGYIAEGTLLTQYMVDVIKVPSDYRQPKSLDAIGQLVNENGANIYATAVPIEAGEQVVLTKLVSAGKETGLAIVVPEGKRAMTIPVDVASGVADLIKPGNAVDIICTLDEQNKAVTVLQNVIVLACKQNILGTQKIKKQDSGAADLGAAAPAMSEEDIPDSVTVAVTPVEAQALALAMQKGNIRLSLRGLNDTIIINLSPVTLSAVSK
jgi:pilus assembly protein CpaB